MLFDHVLLYLSLWSLSSLGSCASVCMSSFGWYLVTEGQTLCWCTAGTELSVFHLKVLRHCGHKIACRMKLYERLIHTLGWMHWWFPWGWEGLCRMAVSPARPPSAQLCSQAGHKLQQSLPMAVLAVRGAIFKRQMRVPVEG